MTFVLAPIVHLGSSVGSVGGGRIVENTV